MFFSANASTQLSLTWLIFNLHFVACFPASLRAYYLWMSDIVHFLLNPERFPEVMFELNIEGYERIKELLEKAFKEER